MWRIYLDTCCLNRPFDDESHDRIRLEAEAVRLILDHIQAGEWEWVSSEPLEVEIAQTADAEKLLLLRVLIGYANRSVPITSTETQRMRELRRLGFRVFDALHIACAESIEADVFLTTDDKLQRRASRVAAQLRIRVMNPLAWLKEVI